MCERGRQGGFGGGCECRRGAQAAHYYLPVTRKQTTRKLISVKIKICLRHVDAEAGFIFKLASLTND